jgi:hypothetical protein
MSDDLVFEEGVCPVCGEPNPEYSPDDPTIPCLNCADEELDDD